MQDDLIGLILGCGCRQKCCCPEKESPAPGAVNTLFPQQARTIPPLRLPDESPLVVPVQFYDSPQRPLMFQAGNTGHHPYVLGAGVFAEAGLGFDFLPGPVLDDGLRLPTALTGVPGFQGAMAVNHQARTVKYLYLNGVAYGDLPVEERGQYLPRQTMINRGYSFTRLDPVLSPSGAGAAAAYRDATQPYAGGPPMLENRTTFGLRVTSRDQLTSAGGLLFTGYVTGFQWGRYPGTQYPDPDTGFITRYTRYLAFGDITGRSRTPIVEGGPVRFYREILVEHDRASIKYWNEVGITDFTPAVNSFFLWDNPENPDRPDGTRTIESIEKWDYFPVEAEYIYVNEGTDTTQPPALAAERWRSPDGLIRVDGPRTIFHANLGTAPFALSTLTAYGETRTGGSWAALCGPPTDPENPASAVAWVLHEAGGDVTLFRPDAAPQTVTRAVFEQDVLRTAAGTFKAFDSYGTDAATWPMPWAIANCEGAGMRAVVLHDAWRDSVRGAQIAGQPGPASWYWPGRPRRPGQPGGPVVPLGLTLADVFSQPAGSS